MTRLAVIVALAALVAVRLAPAAGAADAATPLSAGAVNGAVFDGTPLPETLSPLAVRVQVLLDRAGISPGVIDGFDGENLSSALQAFEEQHGLEPDGRLDAALWQRLEAVGGGDAVVPYTITAEDVAGPFVKRIPDDFAEMAKMKSMAYTSVAEMIAERTHMDIDLLSALNPGARYAKGDEIVVAAPGDPVTGEATRVEVSLSWAEVRAFDAGGKLLAAYPATVGSDSLPSPEGTHTVEAIAPAPNFTYDPSRNFKQGDNTEKLIVPPGPNGPVGGTWIDLSEPTYGIHGTAEPSKVRKSSSHGCVRLTNWDAEELSKLVRKGSTVAFVD